MYPSLCRHFLLAAAVSAATAVRAAVRPPAVLLRRGVLPRPGVHSATAQHLRSGAPPRPAGYFITESELPTSGTETAYDAIARLRPDFLRVRPAQSYNLQPNGGASGPAPAPALDRQRPAGGRALRSSSDRRDVAQVRSLLHDRAGEAEVRHAIRRRRHRDHVPIAAGRPGSVATVGHEKAPGFPGAFFIHGHFVGLSHPSGFHWTRFPQ